MTMNFDYVIVGGGSAGCVLAARLSEDPGVSNTNAPVIMIAEKAADMIKAASPDRDGDAVHIAAPVPAPAPEIKESLGIA